MSETIQFEEKSLTDFQNTVDELPEEVKLRKNAQYLATLDRSMEEARQGKLISKTISELEKYEE